MLKSPIVKHQIEKKVKGVAQKTLNLKDLKAIKIWLPKRSLQDKFATIVQEVEKTKKKYQYSLDELHDLFGSLSQRAFNGELELSKIKLEKPKLSIKINGKKIQLDAKKSSKGRLNAGIMPSFTVESMIEYEKLSNPMDLRVSFEDEYKTLRASIEGISNNKIHFHGFKNMDEYMRSITGEDNLFITAEGISKNLIDTVYGLDNYKDKVTSDYFNKWQEQEKDRIKKLIEQSSFGSALNNPFLELGESLASSVDTQALDRLNSVYGEHDFLSTKNVWIDENDRFKEIAEGLTTVTNSNLINNWKNEHEVLYDLPVTATSFDTNTYETTEVIESISNLSELMKDELFKNIFQTDSYDNIKELVFKLIDEGKLEQVFDEETKRLILKKVEK